MAWQVGQRYRGRALANEIIVERNGKTGTRSIVVLLEVSQGEQQGRRLRYRGYINSSTNIATTLEELRAMGWRGQKLGDWSGIGSKECEWSCMADAGQDQSTGEARMFYRAAFVRPLQTLSHSAARVSDDELEQLNAQLAPMLAPPVNGERRPLPPPPAPAADGVEGEGDGVEGEGDISFP